jgi:hypothetical protein
MLQVTKNAPQMAIIQLGEAFRNFFAGRARYPQFRKKGVHDRFTLTNDQFSIDGCRIRIPNLGWVRMREALRFAGKIMSATVSRVGSMAFMCSDALLGINRFVQPLPLSALWVLSTYYIAQTSIVFCIVKDADVIADAIVVDDKNKSIYRL